MLTQYLGAYLSVRNYIIRSLFIRLDVDSAHYHAFFTTVDQIRDDYWRPRYPEVIQLHALYSHSEDWGKGVGTALVEWGLDIARKAQVPIVVETTSATQFYEKLGFRSVVTKRIQVEGETDFVDMDALVWTVS